MFSLFDSKLDLWFGIWHLALNGLDSVICRELGYVFFDISQRCQQNGKVGVLKLLSLGQVHVRRPPRGVRLGVPHHHHRAVGRQGLGVSRLDVQLAEEAIFLVAGGERHRQPTLDKATCLSIGIDVWILLSNTDTDTQYL